jgi:hypothetical protein
VIRSQSASALAPGTLAGGLVHAASFVLSVLEREPLLAQLRRGVPGLFVTQKPAPTDEIPDPGREDKPSRTRIDTA